MVFIDAMGRLGVWLEPINIEFILLDWELGENILPDVQQNKCWFVAVGEGVLI